MDRPQGQGSAVAVVAERARPRAMRDFDGTGPRTWPARARRFLRQLLETRLVGTGLTISAIVFVCAVFADVIAPYEPNTQDYLALTEAPSATHWLGTDDLGRDVLSRIIYGSRVSLQVGIIAVGIAVTVGVTLGLLAGYLGGL